MVLMDNHMPVMDGVEATSAIRSLPSSKSKILILGCTADVFKETRERMLGVGVDYIVSKPIDENELDDALYRYSERLYQYKPTLLKSSNAEDEETESLLLTFYMALENGDLEEAQEHFQALKAATIGIEDNHLEETLKAIQMKLTLGEVPSQSDLDVLTVLLKDFCK